MLLINKIYVCMLISDVTNTDVVVQSYFYTFRNCLKIVSVIGSTIIVSWINYCRDVFLQLPSQNGSSNNDNGGNNKLVRFYIFYILKSMLLLK